VENDRRRREDGIHILISQKLEGLKELLSKNITKIEVIDTKLTNVTEYEETCRKNFIALDKVTREHESEIIKVKGRALICEKAHNGVSNTKTKMWNGIAMTLTLVFSFVVMLFLAIRTFKG